MGGGRGVGARRRRGVADGKHFLELASTIMMADGRSD